MHVSSLTMEILEKVTAVDSTETRRVRDQDYFPQCISFLFFLNYKIQNNLFLGGTSWGLALQK